MGGLWAGTNNRLSKTGPDAFLQHWCKNVTVASSGRAKNMAETADGRI
jgi:hypothetical protein